MSAIAISPSTSTLETESEAARGRQPLHRLWSRAAGFLTRLTDRTVTLWLALLAVNAVFLPYRSRFHDSLLYGFQVQNAVEWGRFHDDLFLRYGSQDSYSVFSMVAAPLARAIGLHPALFLLYLVANGLFYFAAVRLVRRLVPGRLEAAAGLLLLAVTQPLVGGLGVFHVNENFLTARLPAEALVLFGLERLVAGHPVQGLLFTFAALTVHPLMAFGGLLVTMLWFALRYVPRRQIPLLAGVGAALAVAAFLLARGAGVRLLAPIDEFWLTAVQIEAPYMFIKMWDIEDWGGLLIAMIVVGWARWRFSRDAVVADLLTAVLAVTLLAVVGSFVVWSAPFALILQGQPFRALWLVQVLALPLVVPMVHELWSRGNGPWRGAAVLLLWCVEDGSFSSLGLGLTFFAPLIGLWLRGTARTPRDPGWLWKTLAASAVLVIVLLQAVVVTALTRMSAMLVRLMGPSVLPFLTVAAVPPVLRVLLALAMLAVLARLVGSGWTFRLAALAVCLAAQVCWYQRQAPGLSGIGARSDGAVSFLRGYLASQPASGSRPPTVYWPTGQVDLLWHDLEVNSYFAWFQLAGNVFRRETAVEGHRRTGLVRPFEVELGRRRRLMEPLTRPSFAERAFGVGLTDGPPQLADVLRLCADENLDYAVLRQGYAGWYTARHGEWYVYDTRVVRAKVRSESHPAGVSASRSPATRS